MFHLDLRLLRSFAAVASEASVTRAADRLNLTQPAVSGHIKELEQSLGFLLFHRTSRRVVLSEHGERLLPMVQSLLARAEELRLEAEAMQHDAKTRFRLGAAMYSMDFVDRVELLDAFSAALPGFRYTIDVRLQADQIVDLAGDKLDAALLLGIAVPASRCEFRNRFADSGIIVNETQYPDTLERVVLRRRRVGLLVPDDSELGGFDVIPREALVGQRVAVLSSEHGEDVVNPMAAFLVENRAVPIGLAEGNAMAIERHAQKHGICAIGIGWFPMQPGLVLRPMEGFDFSLDFSLVLGTGANRAARQFFEFARSWQAARESLGDFAPA